MMKNNILNAKLDFAIEKLESCNLNSHAVYISRFEGRQVLRSLIKDLIDLDMFAYVLVEKKRGDVTNSFRDDINNQIETIKALLELP